MNNLQPLFGAILDESKFLYSIKFWIHLFTFAVAIASIYLNGKYLFTACLIIGASEIVAWSLKYFAGSRKDLGQEVLRANMLKEAFGKQSRLSIAYLTSRIPKSAMSKAEQHLNEDYYANLDDDKGKHRLCAVLQESCFWSQHLYYKCAKNGLMKAVLFLLVIFFVGIYYSVYMDNDQLFSAPRVFILLVALVPFWDQIEDVIVWFNSASRLKEIDQRMESIDHNDESDVFALYADYNVITSRASLIPQKVYDDEKDVLNALWEQRTEKA